MNESFVIEYGKNSAINAYISDVLKEYGAEFVFFEGAKYTSVNFYSERKAFKDLICEILIKFYKYSTIRRFYEQSECEKVYFYSFLGTVVSMETDEEKRAISAVIGDKTKINVEGLLGFSLYELKKMWVGLATLTRKLFLQCVTEEDLLSLTGYFIGMDGAREGVLVINDGLYDKISGKKIALADLVGDKEKNLALNVFFNKPKEIIVPEPNKYSEDLIRFLKALGE